MNTLMGIAIFSILGTGGVLVAATLFILFPWGVRRSILPCLVSYASGTLLGTAFLGLIPHALGCAEATSVMAAILLGIIIFFVIEKLVLWRHCHEDKCEVHGVAGPLILVGDALHNLADGVTIAAAFLSSTPLGVATALATIAHEVPQEVGDFAILLDSGYSPTKAFLCNTLSSSSTLLGALVAYFSLSSVQMAIPYILALSAASFLYIATTDLFPNLHRQLGIGRSAGQLLLMLGGIGTIFLLRIHS
jgi:zinc and cadmium transporter